MTMLLATSIAAEKRIPKNYVFPPEKRAGNSVKGDVPVVDLHDHENNNAIQQLIKAGHDFGFFQVINHGMDTKLMDEAMDMFKEVFKLPSEEKMKINTEAKGACTMYTSTHEYGAETTHYWRDVLKHAISNPLEECIKFWPKKPENYREIVREYVIAIKIFGSKMLELIAQGLGLERGYFEANLGEINNTLTLNHYPPSPDPSLTMGLGKHADPSVITILHQVQVPGLQLLKKDDAQWMDGQTLPHAFLILIGSQLEVISNGKLRSGFHRVVTNANEARTSVAFFYNPSLDCLIEPAKALLDQGECSRPRYKSFLHKDFHKAFLESSDTNNREVDDVLDAVKMKV